MGNKKKWKDGKRRRRVAVGVLKEKKNQKRKKNEEGKIWGVPRPVCVGVGGGKNGERKEKSKKMGIGCIT